MLLRRHKTETKEFVKPEVKVEEPKVETKKETSSKKK